MYYIREPDGALIARVADGEIQYYHFDDLGSTLFLTGSDGTVTDEYTYDAWGNLTSHTGDTDQPYQYVGQLGYYAHHQDANLDLLQLGVRFYDPETGRFTQHGSPYTYADSNPVAITHGEEEPYSRFSGPKGFLRALSSLFSRRANEAQNADLQAMGYGDLANAEPLGWTVAREGGKYALDVALFLLPGGAPARGAAKCKVGKSLLARVGAWLAAGRRGKQIHGQFFKQMRALGYKHVDSCIPGTRLRPDAIIFDNGKGIIYELKPNTASGKEAGLEQLAKYLEAVKKAWPGVKRWEGRLIHY